MGRTVEFLFDVVSPTAYLAYKRLPDIAARTGATIAWTPVFLGGIMNATGNVPPGSVPAKGKYMSRDLVRCAARFDIAFTLNPHFPVNTLTLQRAAVSLLDEAGEEAFARFIDACFQAIWVDAKNMGDPAVAGEVLSAAGFDPDELLARAGDPAITDTLKSIPTARWSAAFSARRHFLSATRCISAKTASTMSKTRWQGERKS